MSTDHEQRRPDGSAATDGSAAPDAPGTSPASVPDRVGMTRRSLLAKGAVATAGGVAAGAFLERPASAGTPAGEVSAHNVATYGATGDGVSDDRAAIQAAIDAAADGGGLVSFPPGRYVLGGSIVLKSAVHLRGSGENATFLQLADGVNAPVLVSDPAAGTIYSFSIGDLVVDGNKAHNSSGAGLQLDANDWMIDSVVIRNCAGDGLASVSTNDEAGPDGMESLLTRVKVHDNDGNGITWNGPHDSFWSQVHVFYNGPSANSVDGVLVAGNGFALFVDQLHVYGGHHRYGLHVTTGNATFHNCQVEGAATANVYLEANNVRYNGGTVFSGGQPDAVGFKIGNASNPYIAGLRLETEVDECSGGVFTGFEYGPFNSIVDIVYYNSDGAPAYPAGAQLPIRSYVNITPATSSLPTPAQTQFAGWLALREPAAYPSVTPVDGGVIYVQDGALKYRGASGTVTTIAPA